MMKWATEDLRRFVNLANIPSAVNVADGMTPQQLLDLQGDDLLEHEDNS